MLIRETPQKQNNNWPTQSVIFCTQLLIQLQWLCVEKILVGLRIYSRYSPSSLTLFRSKWNKWWLHFLFENFAASSYFFHLSVAILLLRLLHIISLGKKRSTNWVALSLTHSPALNLSWNLRMRASSLVLFLIRCDKHQQKSNNGWGMNNEGAADDS